MALKNTVQLIAYPNRIGDNLKDLGTVLDAHLSKAIGGVHILPIYPSNADGGFSPLTHKQVDPAYGTWDDVEHISAKYDLCLDLTLNHISDESAEFKDFLEKGFESEHAELFINVDTLEPITKEDLAKIHIRKEKEPFREVTLGNGEKTRVWCTFTEHQIDLDYTSPKTFDLMRDYIEHLTSKGVKLFRLDAFGYITKKIGTSCFLLEPDTYQKLDWFNQTARENGAEILPEVHDHPSYQKAISNRDMYSYGFALPPLALYTFLYNDAKFLKNWLRVCPHNQITVLDTHDGICMPDVENIIPDSNLQKLINDLSDRSGDTIMRRMAGNLHSVGAIYQLTATFFDAMRQDADAYLAARALQFFTPGIPQVYYVGLVADTNDHDLVEETGESRDINRHYYSREEFETKLHAELPQKLIKLMEFRNSHPAFNGEFELCSTPSTELRMRWVNGTGVFAELWIDLPRRKMEITYSNQDSMHVERLAI